MQTAVHQNAKNVSLYDVASLTAAKASLTRVFSGGQNALSPFAVVIIYIIIPNVKLHHGLQKMFTEKYLHIKHLRLLEYSITTAN